MRKRHLGALALLALGAPLIVDQAIGLSVKVHLDPAATPKSPVGLVLGTSPTVHGRSNLFYTARIDAAAKLYHAGRVRGLIVSGDNSKHTYNEPDAMRADLMALGVPEEHITCDYAGLRTLDSVVRAVRVFGQEQVTVISQPFHAERAVFLARRHGMRAHAFGARNPSTRYWLRFRGREVLARCLAVSDVVLGKGPRFLGPAESVALRQDS